MLVGYGMKSATARTPHEHVTIPNPQGFARLRWPSGLVYPSAIWRRFILPAVRPVKVVQELPVPWPRCVKLSGSEIQQDHAKNDM